MLETKWQKLVEREGDFFKNVLLYESLEEHFPNVFDRHHPPFLTVRKGDIFIHYQDEEGRKEFAQFLERQSVGSTENIITTGKNHFQELTLFCQNLSDPKLCSNQELAELLRNYCFLYKQPYPYFNVTTFADYVTNTLLVNAMAEWRLWARDRFNKVHELIEPLFLEIAQRVHLTVKELKFLKPQEIIEVLRMHSKIQCRQRCYFHFEKGSFVLKENMLPEFLQEELPEQTSVLHGQGTFPANVQGIVRVVHNALELEQLQQGEIAVMPMTTPNLPLHYLRKAKAIITDEGGITCHAAVISREFGIPTLMGTSQATKTFQTGDVVQVDTARGIIYKLSASQPEEHKDSTEKT